MYCQLSYGLYATLKSDHSGDKYFISLPWLLNIAPFFHGLNM